ncbi:hypothetical protein T09_4062 [Trichinella sp. T9]|nr:hypothetical protein T09_4062 [Trichinella sp. T9]
MEISFSELFPALTMRKLHVGGRCGGHPNDLCHQTAYICRSIFYANAHTYLLLTFSLKMESSKLSKESFTIV